MTFAEDGTILGERQLVGAWVRFESNLPLFWIDYACQVSSRAADEIWELQDGYGPAGYTPPQGWDWSGIRDSTPSAVAAMFAVARVHIPDVWMAQVLGAEPQSLAEIIAGLRPS